MGSPDKPLQKAKPPKKRAQRIGLGGITVAAVLVVLQTVFQLNGGKVNWWLSIFVYLGCLALAEWGLLWCVFPSKSRKFKYLMGGSVAVAIITVGGIGVVSQYSKDKQGVEYPNDSRAWPALTDAQSKELMTILAPYKPHTWFVLYRSRHAYAFADGLFSVGSNLGCEGRIEQRPDQAKFGIVVWIHKEEPARDALSLFLRKNGYPFSIDDTKANTPGVFFFLVGDKTVGF